MCFVDDKRILIYGGGTMRTGDDLTQRRRDAEEKPGKDCPLITRIYTNEYFAVNLILHHKIKLTANASVLLVPISAIRG